MEERKTGFEACKECFDDVGTKVNVEVCRETSDVCPQIPDHIPNEQVMNYLQIGILGIDYKPKPEADMVNHPPHYNNHPSGIECIEVTEHMSFNVGSAVKYLWRVDDKDNPFQDLDKAIWYLNREIEKRKKNG